MDPSDAFKAAKAKWSNLVQSQPSKSNAAHHEDTEEMASTSNLAAPLSLSVGHEFSRMALAMEQIAGHMPALVAALTAFVAPAPPAPIVAPEVSAPPAAPSSGMNNVNTATAHGASSSSQSFVPTSALKPQPAQDASASGTGNMEQDDEHFDYGLSALFSESEDDIDPLDRCGVCKGSCSKLIYALDCGHYPYCSQCVKSMTLASSGSSYKFKCPYCKKEVVETQILQLLE